MIDKPKNVRPLMLATDDSNVMVTWEELESEPEIVYKIRYKMLTDAEWIELPVDINKMQYLVQYLTPNGTYLFQLRAINKYGKRDSPISSIHIKGKE